MMSNVELHRSYESFQQRVVDEKKELDDKINKLCVFETSPTFQNLPDDERDRLRRQRLIMIDYSDILRERIANFK